MNYFVADLRKQPKLVLRGVMLIGTLILFSNIAFQDYLTWLYNKMFLVVVPVFLTAHALSQDYEHNREGILFTTNTPIYNQMLKRFLYGWFCGQLVVLLSFISAYVFGLEESFISYLTLLINSSFLSVIGLTAGNITKRSLVGYGIPLSYWMIQAVAGFRANELIKYVSVLINIELKNEVIWGNLVVLTLISIVLLLYNIWYIGKGENIRGLLIKFATVFFAVISLTGGIYYYNTVYYPSTIQYKILNNTQVDTFFVVDTKNTVVTNFLKGRNINYKSLDTLGDQKLNNKNIVYIIENKKKPERFNFVNVNRFGVEINQLLIEQGKAVGVIKLSTASEGSYEVLLESNHWSEGDLKCLFEQKMGNFVVVNKGKVIGYSNFDLIRNNIVSNLKIIRPSIVMKKGDVRVVYRGLSIDKVEHILNIWSEVYSAFKKLGITKDVKSTLYIQTGEFEPKRADAVNIYISSQKDFLSPQYGGQDWVRYIAMTTIEDSLFRKIDDENIRSAWSNYVFDSWFIPLIQDKELLAQYNLQSPPKEYYEEFASLLEKDNSTFTILDFANLGLYIGYFSDQNREKSASIISEIMSSSTVVDLSKLEEIFKKYYEHDNVEKIFKIYSNSRKAALLYNTKGWVDDMDK